MVGEIVDHHFQLSFYEDCKIKKGKNVFLEYLSFTTASDTFHNFINYTVLIIIIIIINDM